MQIVEKKISELVEYENNPRINDDAVEPVAKSIEAFGFLQPIVLNSDNVIVCGHTRYQAAIKLGLESVPCVIADDLSEDEIRAYRIVDNKTSEYANWNLDLLDSELKNIDFDLDDWKLSDLCLTDIPDIPTEIQYKEQFGVTIDCKNEVEQRQAFEYVTAGGYQARIVSI